MLYLPGLFRAPTRHPWPVQSKPSWSFPTPRIHNVLTTAFQPTMPLLETSHSTAAFYWSTDYFSHCNTLLYAFAKHTFGWYDTYS